MNFTNIADVMWRARPAVVCVVILFFIVPLLRLLSLPFETGSRAGMRINKPFGIWEHFTWPFRDWVIMPYLAAGVLWHVWLCIEHRNLDNAIVAAVYAALVALGLVNRRWRRNSHIALAKFVSACPAIHPQEFFDRLLCSSGAIRHKLPALPFSTIDPAKIDFRDAKKGKGVDIAALLTGIWSTFWLARLILLTGRVRGQRPMNEVASAAAVVWGSRICQMTRALISIENKELLPDPGKRCIYLFSHGSFFDFILVPLLLAARTRPGNNLPAFLLARDHFRDNFIFYRLLGIGLAAEKLGMIFVDRKANDRMASARKVAKDAAAKITDDNMPVAIFPQGTRACPFIDYDGERLGCGYYTVKPRARIRAYGGHLKKGAAHIAAQTATELKDRGINEPVTLVPVGIRGAAAACPRGSARPRAGVHIKLHVGAPIIVAADARAPNVGDIHKGIDNGLKAAVHIHADLERMFFEDIRKILDPMKMEEIAIAMRSWRGDDYLVHSVLDAIYACRAEKWRELLGELAHLMLNFAPREDILAFKARVADIIPV